MKYYTKFLKGMNGSDDLAWRLIKWPYTFFWCVMMGIMIRNCNACPYPVGICKIYSFSILFTPVGKIFLVATIAVHVLMYLFEIKMWYTTFILFLISCIVMSVHESNGMFSRATVYSVIWFAQFVAYVQWSIADKFDIRYWRKQYSIQAIAAAYTLAGIAKLYASGIGWVNVGSLFSLQIIKNYASTYADTGSIGAMQYATYIAQQLIEHKALLTFMLALSLVLETFCLVVVINKTLRKVFGFGLLFMHIGIAVILGIGISAIAFPMIVFFINPLYPLTFLFRKNQYTTSTLRIN